VHASRPEEQNASGLPLASTNFSGLLSTDGGVAVRWLNDLQWIDGQILANVWMRDCLARIDPSTGAVTAWVKLEVRSPVPWDWHAARRGFVENLRCCCWEPRPPFLHVLHGFAAGAASSN
jgi:hypothetical protein